MHTFGLLRSCCTKATSGLEMNVSAESLGDHSSAVIHSSRAFSSTRVSSASESHALLAAHKWSGCPLTARALSRSLFEHSTKAPTHPRMFEASPRQAAKENPEEMRRPLVCPASTERFLSVSLAASLFVLFRPRVSFMGAPVR